MKRFIHENPTLAFGIGLPMALVVIFILAAGIPNLTATPPRYDAIFAGNYVDNGVNSYVIRVVNGRIDLSYNGNCGYANAPQLFRYQVSSGTLKPIATGPAPILPRECKPEDYQTGRASLHPISVPELEGVTLDASNPAPDGYEFTFDTNYGRGGLLPSLFFGFSSYGNEPVLRKGSYQIKLPVNRGYYYASNTRFIGWVVAP